MKLATFWVRIASQFLTQNLATLYITQPQASVEWTWRLVRWTRSKRWPAWITRGKEMQGRTLGKPRFFTRPHYTDLVFQWTLQE